MMQRTYERNGCDVLSHYSDSGDQWKGLCVPRNAHMSSMSLVITPDNQHVIQTTGTTAVPHMLA